MRVCIRGREGLLGFTPPWRALPFVDGLCDFFHRGVLHEPGNGPDAYLHLGAREGFIHADDQVTLEVVEVVVASVFFPVAADGVNDLAGRFQ